MLCTELTDHGAGKAWLWKVMLSAFLQDLPCQPTSSCPDVQPPHVGLWPSKTLPEQQLETGKFTLQTRLAHLYSGYLLHFRLSKAVSSADISCANGGGKLVNKACMPEAHSTMTLWCVANAGPPRSPWICGHWMSIQCLSVCRLRQTMQVCPALSTSLQTQSE